MAKLGLLVLVALSARTVRSIALPAGNSSGIIARAILERTDERPIWYADQQFGSAPLVNEQTLTGDYQNAVSKGRQRVEHLETFYGHEYGWQRTVEPLALEGAKQPAWTSVLDFEIASGRSLAWSLKQYSAVSGGSNALGVWPRNAGFQATFGFGSANIERPYLQEGKTKTVNFPGVVKVDHVTADLRLYTDSAPAAPHLPPVPLGEVPKLRRLADFLAQEWRQGRELTRRTPANVGVAPDYILFDAVLPATLALVKQSYAVMPADASQKGKFSWSRIFRGNKPKPWTKPGRDVPDKRERRAFYPQDKQYLALLGTYEAEVVRGMLQTYFPRYSVRSVTAWHEGSKKGYDASPDAASVRLLFETIEVVERQPSRT